MTSGPDLAHRLRTPNAFTEEGVIPLATVLNSDTSVRATKQVIRTFVEASRLSRDGGSGSAEVSRIPQTGTPDTPAIHSACG